MASTASPIHVPGGSMRMPLRPLRPSRANVISNPQRTSPQSYSNTHQPTSQTPTAGKENHTPTDDSSDDDSNVAPVLSAAAEELLGGRTSQGPTSQHQQDRVDRSSLRQSVHRNYAEHAGGSPVVRDMEPLAAVAPRRAMRSLSPEQRQRGGESVLRTKSPRIVRISSVNRHGSPSLAPVRRNQARDDANGSPAQRESANYKTPAPALRSRSYIPREDGSPVSSERLISGEHRGVYQGSSGKSLAYTNSANADIKETHSHGKVTKDPANHSSLRIKRLQGTFLRGPARRGMIRRQSEVEQSPLQRNGQDFADLYGRSDHHGDEDESPLDENAPSKGVRFTGPSGFGMPTPLEDPQEDSASEDKGASDRAAKNPSSSRPVSAGLRNAPAERPQPPLLFAQRDKENEPPSYQMKVPEAADVLTDLPPKPLKAVMQSIPPAHTHESPKRAPLGPRTINTPLRPAPPPPPKMNVVDTATAAAGAMASQKRKKQAVASMTVNGRRYTRLDCIGRGGSGKVFRVMAENYKLFALKRVSLKGMDEMAIRGFKGEINLLQKLKEVDRVVRLIDYEVNDERQTLTVLMEIGELDLKNLLDPRLDEQTGAFDVTFTRYIWREMLECVQSVHNHDVVHSDLKPANFVMAQGKLKLIDFGIANAIADDTVNVHREQQIGTPNYMAPEALLDTNAHERGLAGVTKLMKLGKPSDVWSLGCILYQIVYGKPPFGHITATHSKVMAIVSERHQISFPDHGLGGASVPIGLQRILKRCLQRDQTLRPGIAELLGERDPFLHPDADGLIPLSADLLGMIQRKLVSTIRQREGVLPDDGELAMWQPNMFENVRNAIRDGKIQV